MKKNKKEPKWEYGHDRELGKDGKPTGRTISFKRDQRTGKTESIYHKHFKAY